MRTDQTPDAFGRSRLGGIGHFVAGRIEEESGIETRVTALGHGQRGGTPTARDRVLSSRFGVRAVELLAEGKLGHRVSLQGDRIVDLPLAEATKKLKMVDDEW